MLNTATVTSAGIVQQRLDEGRLRAIQFRVFALCTLVTMLDGIDNQSIGVVAPLMSKDLGLDKTALGSIFSVTQIGATIGALLFGFVGDRFGRKTAIGWCVTMMTVFMVCLGKTGPILKRAHLGMRIGEMFGTSEVYAGADHSEAA
ncbi:MFS transporter [Novosphingobium naphthalenivorans]|uniref:MFS transporter n=1 Tax=Novosphingobium naphthalenivorans TaxID=273168 RepID=UPI000832A8F3|nr:MFS transporter [Novosphingobium naphthalenivorans]